MKSLLTLMLAVTAAALAAAVYGGIGETDVAKLKSEVAEVMAMSEPELDRQLPARSGIFFVMCPTPGCGNAQGSSFGWSPAEPGVIRCDYCRKKFPSADCPENHTAEVRPPSGKVLKEPYYLAPDGRKYYFSAGASYRKGQYFAAAAYRLSRLYHLTGDEAYARRAALILTGIARNYPDFAFKFDFPAKEVIWYRGLPGKAELAPDHRTSRWSWWAYTDIPVELVLSYDLIRDSRGFKTVLAERKLDERKEVVENFFAEASNATLRYPERFHNMSGRFWRDLAITGRVCDKENYVNYAILNGNRYLNNSFYFDGFWKEAAVSYHAQSVLFLSRAAEAIDGYRGKSAAEHFPMLAEAQTVLGRFQYPDGRRLPLSDTWVKPLRQGGGHEAASFLSPALGYAALCGDLAPGQTQLHLAFTPKVGHRHFDTLGITLFADDREMLSDVGYTHTRMSCYVLQSAAHNLVVADFANQRDAADASGDLLYMDVADPDTKVISVDGRRAYPALGVYRRTLFLLKRPDGTFFAIDFFEAGPGAANLDYFLHGSADVDETLDLNAKAVPADLIPAAERARFRMPDNEQQRSAITTPYNAYGFLKETARVEFAPGAEFGRAAFRADGLAPLAVLWPLDRTGEVWTGRAPSVRRAGEDNQTVLKYFRNFLVLRKKGGGAPAHFAVVLAPGKVGEAVSAVRSPSPGVLTISLQEGDYWVFHRRGEPLSVGGLSFRGEYGCVRLTPERKLRGYFIVNGALQGDGEDFVHAPVAPGLLATVAGNTLGYRSATEPGADLAPFVRLRHRDGAVYGYLVKKHDAAGGRVEGETRFGLEEGPGDTFFFRHLPQTRWRRGDVTVECFRRRAQSR